MGAQIRFICTAIDHPPRLASLEFGLTVHLREWAFCPAGEARGHQWRQVEAIALDALIAPPAGDAVTAAN
jgi:hypothetical protein